METRCRTCTPLPTRFPRWSPSSPGERRPGGRSCRKPLRRRRPSWRRRRRAPARRTALGVWEPRRPSDDREDHADHASTIDQVEPPPLPASIRHGSDDGGKDGYEDSACRRRPGPRWMNPGIPRAHRDRCRSGEEFRVQERHDDGGEGGVGPVVRRPGNDPAGLAGFPGGRTPTPRQGPHQWIRSRGIPGLTGGDPARTG